MKPLNKQSCVPCQGGVPPLGLKKVLELKKELHEHWQLTHDNTRLHRSFKFKDFAAPMHLAQQIGELAEREWHHPELAVGWGHLEIALWTHKINGLVESDFILAAKIDELAAD